MNAEPLSNDLVEKALLEMSGWELDDEDNKLRCELKFPDFRAAMAFLTRFAFENLVLCEKGSRKHDSTVVQSC